MKQALTIEKSGQGVQMNVKYVCPNGRKKYQFSVFDPYTKKYHFSIYTLVPTSKSHSALVYAVSDGIPSRYSQKSSNSPI